MFSEAQDKKHIVIILSKPASKSTSQKSLMRMEEEERGRTHLYKPFPKTQKCPTKYDKPDMTSFNLGYEEHINLKLFSRKKESN